MFWLPIIAGATIGALTNKDPIKGAIIGGTLGAAGGAAFGAGAGGAAGGAGGSGLLGSTAATQGATGLIGAGGVGATGASVAGTTGATAANAGYAAGANPAAFLAPTGQEVGMANAFNMATNAPINVAASAVPTSGSIMGEIGGANLVGAGLPTNVTTMQDLATKQLYGADNAMLGNPMMGGINPLSEADYAKIASTPATAGSSLFDDLKPYFNVRDLTGAAQVAAQYQQRPQMPTAPAGGVSRGQAPQGTDVMALLQTIKQPERRRISLV